MTPEEVNELKDIIKAFKDADLATSIMVGCLFVGAIIYTIWQIYRMKKIKKMHQQWKSTLTDEQLKTIKRSDEYFK